MKILVRQLGGNSEWGAVCDRINVNNSLCDYETQIRAATIQGGFHSIFSNNGVLSFGLYAGVRVQDVAVVELNLDLLFKQDVTSVMFGCCSVGRRPNNLEIIEQSSYYVRDNTGAVIDLVTGTPVNLTAETVFTVWAWATRVDSDVGYMVVNPELVSLRTDIEGVDHYGNNIKVLNNDLTLRSFFEPKGVSGVIQAGPQLYASNSKARAVFECPHAAWGVDLKNTTVLPESVIISNVGQDTTRITITVSESKKKAWGLVTLRINTAGPLDLISTAESNLSYPLVILY